jgi:hypothetical protein
MESSRLKPNGRTCLLRFELDERVIFTNVISRNFLKIACKRTLQHFDFTDFTIAGKVLEPMHMLIKCTNKIKFSAYTLNKASSVIFFSRPINEQQINQGKKKSRRPDLADISVLKTTMASKWLRVVLAKRRYRGDRRPF